MTIKRYKPIPRMESRVFNWTPVTCDGMEESAKGDYLKVADLKERLDDLLFNNINEACDIMSFLYKLQEELQ